MKFFFLYWTFKFIVNDYYYYYYYLEFINPEDNIWVGQKKKRKNCSKRRTISICLFDCVLCVSQIQNIWPYIFEILDNRTDIKKMKMERRRGMMIMVFCIQSFHIAFLCYQNFRIHIIHAVFATIMAKIQSLILGMLNNMIIK